MLTFALFVAVGAVVGFAGGLFAIGGALIAIPVLTAGFGFTQHLSQGTAMLMAVASALMTLTIYARKKVVRVRDGIILILCSTAMSLVASQLVRFVPDAALQRGFGAFLIALALVVWFVHLGEGNATAPLHPAAQAGIGTLGGFLSGFFVVGGALVSVPLIEAIAGYSQQRAQALVLLMLVPAASVGLISYATNGYVRWDAAVALSIGAVALAPLGTRVALATKARVLRRWFAIVQAAAGVLLIAGR